MKKLYLSLLLLSSSVLAMQTPNHLLLPINDSLEAGRRLKLKIEIPPQFTQLYITQDTDLEFVLKGKTRETTSEIITVRQPLQNVTDIRQKLYETKKFVEKLFPELKVLKDEYEDRSSHKMGLLVLACRNAHKKEREITWTQVYAGPASCSGYQYSIVMPEMEDYGAALKKLKHFSQDNAVVVNY